MKPTIIFLHGGPGFKDYLAPFFSEWSDHFQTVFYDQLQGDSISIEDLIDQLDDIVSEAKGKKILLGHSWGGVLAGEYAIRYSKKIDHLILMSTGLCHSHWKEEFEQEKLSRGLAKAAPEEIFLTNAERGEFKEFLERTWSTFHEGTFDALYGNYVQRFDLRVELAKTPIPIKMIFGTEDIRFPARIGRTLGLPTFEMVGAGHFPFLKKKQRDLILAHLLNWI